MRTTGVIVRFLSLLDVALILLGILLLGMAQAQIRTPTKTPEAATPAGADAVREALSGRFLHLYAGTAGEERGKVYVLDPSGKRLRTVATDRPDDVAQEIAKLEQQKPGQPRQERTVLLLVSDRGFDTMWGPRRLAELEKAWGLKILPVYNINLDRGPAK